MPNEFTARNGIIAQNNSTVSGSLTVTQGITGSLFGTASFATSASWAPSSGWGLTGNSGTSASTNFIGTTDDIDLVFRANSIERIRINSSTGNLLIGTTTDVTSGLVIMNSTTKGFLPPRMTLINKTSMSAPATGLEVFDTDNNRPSYRDSSGWKNVANTDDITLVQNGNQLFLAMNFI